MKRLVTVLLLVLFASLSFAQGAGDVKTKFYDFDDLPPGIALVAEGQMRLLALDEREEPFKQQQIAHGFQDV